MSGYNNYFPNTYSYQPYTYSAPASTQPWNTQPPQQTQLGQINWVQGEAGARSVPVPAGQKAMLMDSETNVFYVKSSDASGMPLPLRTFEYKEITKDGTKDDSAPATYVTHEELEERLKALSAPKEEKTNEFII